MTESMWLPASLLAAAAAYLLTGRAKAAPGGIGQAGNTGGLAVRACDGHLDTVALAQAANVSRGSCWQG